MENIIETKTTDGRIIRLDTSDEACKKFGFSHGDKVKTISELEAIIIGVGPSNEGDDVLWYNLLRSKSGGVCYYGHENRNLAEIGFRKI
ncbi:MAG: hypothetical protein WC545_02815 [Patescibacteria group bacterium]